MEISALHETALFRGTTRSETGEMLACLGAERRTFEKGAVLCRVGDTAASLGLVLQGSVHVESNDVWGKRSILDSIGPGQIFAETYACLPEEPLMVDVVAAERCEVLFLNMGRLLRTCSNSCTHHARLIQNLLAITAQKNLTLSRRMFHIAPKTIRGRLLSYLSFQAERQGSRRFTIPFDRQQLADYLGVDRSALSSELGKMRDEGLLTFQRNLFELKE